MVLEAHGFGVAFNDRVILSHIDLQIPPVGVLNLMGPAGEGKSTLVRTIAGLNMANPALTTWGTVRYGGELVSPAHRPAVVTQHARLFVATVLENLLSALPERSSLTQLAQRELALRVLAQYDLGMLAERLLDNVVQFSMGIQRRLAIVRTLLAGPRLICIDEPTSELPESERAAIIRLLRAESERRAILLITHNRQDAIELGGLTALLAGGRIQEVGPTLPFFGSPQTKAGLEFVRAGRCSVASPSAKAEELAPEAEPPAPAGPRPVSQFLGPRGFLWLLPGRLAGTPCPGIVESVEHDLAALARVGVTILVSLMENEPDVAAGQRYGIRIVWFPIPDMQAPTVPAATETCRGVARWIRAGRVVAFHCKAGLGRTGTMLAAYLITQGHSAVQALERVRAIEPRWVQSEVQIRFLEAFGRALASPSPSE